MQGVPKHSYPLDEVILVDGEHLSEQSLEVHFLYSLQLLSLPLHLSLPLFVSLLVLSLVLPGHVL